MASNSDKRWYVRDRAAGQPRQVWLFTDRTATNIGVTNPHGGAGTYFVADDGESIWDCIDRQTPWLKPEVIEGRFYEMKLGPAEFYPRIARPIALGVQPTLWTPPREGEKAYVASARGQAAILVRKLELICQTVQPSNRTLRVYGHEIRNLLILAATEAEMHWRGILRTNGSRVAKPNSNEFVKLLTPLKLAGYAVAFHDFPDIAPVRPFAGWTPADPTNSLGWYAAYHGVKHNREEEFERGTLGDAISAVSACVALLVAQFGPVALGTKLSGSLVISCPEWSIEYMYIPGVDEVDWTPVHHPELS
ncbi:hypothetical protein ACVME8_010771 [Bradyrhizobium diazoefficiens]